jgi:hypothetical protein
MHMPNRSAKFVSAIFASFLAGAALATISHSAARAADDCLSGPKDQTPQGGHWYYRIDHATKRHCWYLREDGEKLSQTALPNSPSSTKPISPTEAATLRSIANAHAELPAQAGIEQPSRNDALTPAMPADAAIRENGGATRTPDAEAQPSIVASRWPDPAGSNSSTNPMPFKSDTVASVNSTSRTQPPSVLAASRFAPADLSSKTPTYSAQMQFAALIGALALAGIIGSVIFKFISTRRPRRGRIRKRRGAIWESTDDDSILLSAHPGAEAPRRTGFAHDLDRTGDPSDRTAEFFSQLSKRAPT